MGTALGILLIVAGLCLGGYFWHEWQNHDYSKQFSIVSWMSIPITIIVIGVGVLIAVLAKIA